MSPEVAASVVNAVSCPYCKAQVGARCHGLDGRNRPTPHQQRVLADLFNRQPRKAPR